MSGTPEETAHDAELQHEATDYARWQAVCDARDQALADRAALVNAMMACDDAEESRRLALALYGDLPHVRRVLDDAAARIRRVA